MGIRFSCPSSAVVPSRTFGSSRYYELGAKPRPRDLFLLPSQGAVPCALGALIDGIHDETQEAVGVPHSSGQGCHWRCRRELHRWRNERWWPRTSPRNCGRLVLSADSITIEPAQPYTFTATGRLSDGTVVSGVELRWEASGGAISSAGSYTAGVTPGQYLVIATLQDGTVADTSIVTILDAGVTLLQLVLNPAAFNLTPGQTGQFTVAGNWSDGSTGIPAVAYSASGGTITAGGLYTAGTSAGTYRVIATQQGGTKADTSAVTVTTPPVTLAQLVLTPTSTTLLPNSTQQFTISGVWSDGSTTVPATTYSATGGNNHLGRTVHGGDYCWHLPCDRNSAGRHQGRYEHNHSVAGFGDRNQPRDSDSTDCESESNRDALPPQGRSPYEASRHSQGWDGIPGEPGTVMDGQGATRFAFDGSGLAVRIRDLEMMNYASDSTLGAIQGYNARDWTLENLNVHHNSGYGANLRGHFTVLGGTFHHNGRLGIGVTQSAGGVIMVSIVQQPGHPI